MCGGAVQIRKTKRRKNYYICENNPKSCNYISWDKPKKGEKWEQKNNEELEVKTKKSKKKTIKKKTTKK